LTTAVNRFMNRDVEQSTANAYWRAEDKLTDWRIMIGDHHPDGTLPPPTETTLIFYCSWLATVRCLAPGTIASYLSGIAWAWARNDHRLVIHGPDGNVKPDLAKCLKGIRRDLTAPMRTRFPITTPRLSKVLSILAVANPRLSATEVKCYRSLLSNNHYALCRISETTSNTTTQVDRKRRALGEDVTLHTDNNGKNFYRLAVKHSKTLCRVKQGVDINVYANGTDTCPHEHMRVWLAARQLADDEPLYHHDDLSYVTRSRVSDVLQNCLEHLGWNPKQYNTHSLRSGGAISALASNSGVTVAGLKALGRWSDTSNAYLAYLRHMPQGFLAKVSASMGNLTSSSITEVHERRFCQRFD
jgi:hypothetical protein